MNPSIELNGGVFQFFNAEPATVSQSNPLIWVCYFFLVITILFVLQPLYLTPHLRANPKADRVTPALPSGVLKRSRKQQKKNSPISAVIPAAVKVSPLKIDRLVIADRAILASCHQSSAMILGLGHETWRHDGLATSSTISSAVPATAIVRFERSITQFLHWAQQSQADIIIITGPKASLDLDAACRCSYQLQTQAAEIVLLNNAQSDRGFSAHSHQPNLETHFYHFLQHRLAPAAKPSFSPATGSSENPSTNATDYDVYILLRSRLHQLMELWHWSLDREVGSENLECRI